MSDPLLQEVSSLRTLDQVLSWGLARTPPAQLTEVVTQDEFTHHVIIRVSNRVFLVFDAN
jgi:hypothetical protein